MARRKLIKWVELWVNYMNIYKERLQRRERQTRNNGKERTKNERTERRRRVDVGEKKKIRSAEMKKGERAQGSHGVLVIRYVEGGERAVSFEFKVGGPTLAEIEIRSR